MFPCRLYGKDGEIACEDLENQEITMLALHLQQINLVVAFLVFGAGLVYWYGLIVNQRVAVVVGATVLLLDLGVMFEYGGIDPIAFPFLVLTALLAFVLKQFDLGDWQYLGWTVFILIVLGLGFRIFPLFTPVETVQTVKHYYRFPPEKLVLMLLVPPMVLVPWSDRKSEGHPKRPWLMLLLILAGILVATVPIALITGFATPGLTALSIPYWAYWLAYNLLYTCVLEESFFRGILQEAFIRGFNRTLPPVSARATGITVAAFLFGLAHFGGEIIYVILATLAGIGYGLAYDLTGRLHYAVWVHFAVNTVRLLAFSEA
jgi:membrane protease YdiL (CAAX protease family)